MPPVSVGRRDLALPNNQPNKPQNKFTNQTSTMFGKNRKQGITPGLQERGTRNLRDVQHEEHARARRPLMHQTTRNATRLPYPEG